MAGVLRDGLASHSEAPLHPRPAREPLAHTLTQRSSRCSSQCLRSRRRRWRRGAGSGGRWPPAPGAQGSTEPRRPQRRQPLSIGRPGRAARVNYACPGQRRGVTAAAGCGRRARPGPAPLGPSPGRPPGCPAITYSVELGGFHSEAKTRRAEKLREAAVHPHSPCSGSKHGKPAPRHGGEPGRRAEAGGRPLTWREGFRRRRCTGMRRSAGWCLPP